LRIVSTTPASLLDLGKQKGLKAPGFDADLVLITHNLEVIKAIVSGEIVLEEEPTPHDVS